MHPAQQAVIAAGTAITGLADYRLMKSSPARNRMAWVLGLSKLGWFCSDSPEYYRRGWQTELIDSLAR